MEAVWLGAVDNAGSVLLGKKNRLLYNRPGHRQIEIWLVPAEPANFPSIYGRLKPIVTFQALFL